MTTSTTPVGCRPTCRSGVLGRRPLRAIASATDISFGYFEVRAKAVAEPDNMVAFWMIGYEDTPQRSGEICICEIFGRDVEAGTVHVGMGVHPFSDPYLLDDFERVPLEMDATAFHVYAAEWTPTDVHFYVDSALVKTVDQSPQYPMQFMLGVYEFEPGDEPGTARRRLPAYPKEFVVDHMRGHRPRAYPPPG